MHRVYGTVSAGRDAPYLASDVPPVWKHGYVPPPRPSSFDLPLIHFPLVRFLPSISTRSNPPVRDLTGTQSSPVTVSLLFSLSPSLFLHLRISVSSRWARILFLPFFRSITCLVRPESLSPLTHLPLNSSSYIRLLVKSYGILCSIYIVAVCTALRGA